MRRLVWAGKHQLGNAAWGASFPSERALPEGGFDSVHPGTYFASVRVKAERHGDATDPFTQVKNIARARIIVEA